MPYDRNIRFDAAILNKILNRGITPAMVETALRNGIIIERFHHGDPERYLVLYWQDDQPFPVVAADDHESEITIVATAYYPAPERWNADFTRRTK
jgi:hypothetical protein